MRRTAPFLSRMPSCLRLILARQVSASVTPAAALLVSVLLVCWAAPAPAQQNRLPPEVNTRLTTLEREQAEIKTELSALRDRLDALLGPAPESRILKLNPGNAPLRGNPDAPITLTVFGDYQSLYCVRVHYVLKRLLEEYPNALRIVYRQYPLTALHPQAQDTALAALAAGKQGKFWELNDLLFQSPKRVDATALVPLAQEAGLNLERFEADRHAPDVLALLQEDEAAAAQAGVTGVPTVFINGRLMATWRHDFLKSHIDQLRKK